MSTTTLDCFSKNNSALPIQILFENESASWLTKQSKVTQAWAKANPFKQKKILLLPNKNGALEKVIVLLKNAEDWLSLGALPFELPEGTYSFEGTSKSLLPFAYLAWGLGAYQYTRYKKAKRSPAKLAWTKEVNQKEINNQLEAIYLTRDLINTPADHMMPQNLAEVGRALAKKHKASFKEIVGEHLLKANFPCVYHVGRGSAHEPRLIELRWGNKKHPKLTLVGKGVCFDTGGLDLKDDKGMLTMKKDMGGAAHVLGLAQLIMAQSLPIQLRVLIPAVENAISGNAYHPGDVLTSRTGKTIEITNTDAEGRLILCDALAAAAEENPELLIDFATLTGAARIAVGTDIAAFFTNDEKLARQVEELSQSTQDPAWRLPLYAPYLRSLDSMIADLSNCGPSGYAGASVAALFLESFIPVTQQWLHFDIMAFNLQNRPGKPAGGEAMAIRLVYALLKSK